jgi:hypothetical protein
MKRKKSISGSNCVIPSSLPSIKLALFAFLIKELENSKPLPGGKLSKIKAL